VLLSRASSLGLGISDLFRRRAASNELNEALDLHSNNPLYLMELGRIRLKTPFLRLDAERLFRKALSAAVKRKDSRVLAEVHWEIGQIHERRYVTMANRRTPTSSAQVFDADRAISDWHYTADFFNDLSVPVEDAGELDYRKAEDQYRAALAADSAHLGAAAGLLGLLYDGGRYEEMVSTVNALRHAMPNEARLLLGLGLALHRLDRDADAAPVFDTAIALLPAGEQREMLGLEKLLRKDDASDYARLAERERAEFDELYWSVADPLRLTPINEARVEFLSRVAYADLRFSSAEFHVRGWRSDRGDIYIRYGPPPLIGTLAPETQEIDNSESMARVTTIWYYPDSKLRFVFVGPPAMNYARFAGDFAAYAENVRYLAPVSFDNLKARLPVDSVGVQVASFRGERRGVSAVSIFADIPTARLLRDTDVSQATLETGLFLSDGRRRLVAAARDTAVVRLDRPDAVAGRAWHRSLAPGEYLYRVEARQRISGRSARGLAALTVPEFPAGQLLLSDILVARHIGLRSGGTKPRSRDDLLITPNGSLTFSPGDTVYIYWETYGLAADSAGTARAGVELTLRVDRIERQGAVEAMIGGLGDALGLTAKGDDRVSLRYDRMVTADVRERAPDYLAIAIGQSPPGVYTLEIRVTDLLSKATASQRRVLTVRGR
jgi:GWxTD domain-containing protein